MAPLLSNYLSIAANGVIPGKKHKAALLSLGKAMKLNVAGKSGDQWADVIDTCAHGSRAPAAAGFVRNVKAVSVPQNGCLPAEGRQRGGRLADSDGASLARA